jgi:hypothetical protein
MPGIFSNLLKGTPRAHIKKALLWSSCSLFIDIILTVAGWIGKHLDTWVFVLPRNDLLAFHVLLAAKCLLWGRKKLLIFLADREYSRILGVRFLETRDFSWYQDFILPDPVSVEQAAFHYARSATYTVSPLPVNNLPKLVVLGNYPEKNFWHWKDLPTKGNLEIEVSESSTMDTLFKYREARRVILQTRGIPEGFFWTKGERTLVHPDLKGF